MINRRTALAGCAALGIRGVAAQASAEPFPSRPIALVVPFAAGGSTDALARALADALRPRLGQPVIVDNRPGAGGAIANEFVARAAPDGHTLLMGGSSLTILPALAKSAVDPVADFTAISQVLTLEIFLLARADLPVRNLKELVAYAKANLGKLTYGSSGNGSVTHMQMELLKSMTGIHVLHIPYRGAAPALQDMLGGGRSTCCSTASSLQEPTSAAAACAPWRSQRRCAHAPSRKCPPWSRRAFRATTLPAGPECWAPRVCRTRWCSVSTGKSSPPRKTLLSRNGWKRSAPPPPVRPRSNMRSGY